MNGDGMTYVAGHTGLVGSAIWRALEQGGFQDIIGRASSELDLRNRPAVFEFMLDTRPSQVVIAAAKVGGILANATYPVDFLSDNLQIQTNILDAAHECGVERLLFLGSSCIYPREAPQPMSEESLLTGPLESTNEAYAIAKIAGVKLVQAYRRQYGHRWISAMPTNLYGPGDNFDLDSSHVLPALIHRMHDARISGASEVELWGTGTPRREFLHVDDLASAALALLDRYDDEVPINVGTGTDVSISELAAVIAGVVGYKGHITWDSSKPDGTPRKLLNVSRLRALGWEPSIDLSDGIRSTYAWFVADEQRSSAAQDSEDHDPFGENSQTSLPRTQS